MLWKEIFVESGLRLNLFARVIVFILLIGSFVPIGTMLVQWVNGNRPGLRNSWEGLADDINQWIRFLGTLVACLMLLAVAVRSFEQYEQRTRQANS